MQKLLGPLRGVSSSWLIFIDFAHITLLLFVGNISEKNFPTKSIVESQGGGGVGTRDAHPPQGPNSFIFMQFSAKNLRPLRKILDPPLKFASTQ